MQEIELYSLFVICWRVTKLRSIAAVERRIEFAHAVSRSLAEVLDEFITSDDVAQMEWSEGPKSGHGSRLYASITEKTASSATDRSQITFSVDAAGEASVNLIEWEMDGEGQWTSEEQERKFEVYPDEDVDDVVARLLLKAMGPNTNTVCRSLKRFLDGYTAPKLSEEFDPAPT